MIAGKTVARAGRGAIRGFDGLEKGFGSLGRKVGTASGAVMIGAAVAGAVSAHPLQPVTEAYQEAAFGDKNAMSTVARGAFVSGLEGAFRTPNQQSQIDDINSYPEAPMYQDRQVNDRVNGALVFGLYNRRLVG
jgi:hypothetical protein